MPWPTKAEITQLAKAIHASHLVGPDVRHPKAIPKGTVDQLWREANAKEKADYRWEATQILRTTRRAW